jgi:hypothetical protein
VKAHVAIRIHLKIGSKQTLHFILRRFASRVIGWQFPRRQSEEYQGHHEGSAGFVLSQAIDGVERAAVAIAPTE